MKGEWNPGRREHCRGRADRSRRQAEWDSQIGNWTGRRGTSGLLTSEVASKGGLPQKRLLRAMPADSMLPVFQMRGSEGASWVEG